MQIKTEGVFLFFLDFFLFLLVRSSWKLEKQMIDALFVSTKLYVTAIMLNLCLDGSMQVASINQYIYGTVPWYYIFAYLLCIVISIFNLLFWQLSICIYIRLYFIVSDILNFFVFCLSDRPHRNLKLEKKL